MTEIVKNAERDVQACYKELARATARLKEYDYTTVNYGVWGAFMLCEGNRDEYVSEVAYRYRKLYNARNKLAEYQRSL